MADNLFEDPRLAAIYDVVDSDRSDIEAYLAIAAELGAHTVLDIGCGTGVFACQLSEAGFQATGVDPAAAMLDVARAKPRADRVRWIHGLVTDLPPLQVDVATMTGNVAQVFLDDVEWDRTLEAAFATLRPGGTLVFETRRPERKGWEEWNRAASYQRLEIPNVGLVETWNEVTEVALPFVTFEGVTVFHADGSVLTSTSTLRFRSRDEVATSLERAGFTVRDVREAPDRPGKEHVFLAERVG